MRQRRGDGWTFRRNGVWYIGYFADGKKVRESTGCRKSPRVGKDGKEKPPTEVADRLRQRMNELDDGKWQNPAKPLTFDDLLELVRDDWRGRGRKSSLKAKGGQEQANVRRLRDAFGHAEARSITGIRLSAYATNRLDAGAAVSTVRNDLNILKHGMSLAVKRGDLPNRPPFPTLVPTNERQGFFERKEFEALLVELPEHMRGAAAFMYWTGWRSKSEVFTRQWRHVDLDGGKIRLDVNETKNKNGREFPFGLVPDLVDVIDAQRRYTDEAQRRTGQVIPWVFHREGKRFSRHFYRAWKKACIKAGVAGRIPHDFRRTAVRNLVQVAGVSEKIAMELTGHRTRSVLDRYNISTTIDREIAVAKLAAASPDRKVLPFADPQRTQKAAGE
jgi:integrase